LSFSHDCAKSDFAIHFEWQLPNVIAPSILICISSLESDARLTKIHLIIDHHTDTLKTMARLISSSNCVDLDMLSRASV